MHCILYPQKAFTRRELRRRAKKSSAGKTVTAQTRMSGQLHFEPFRPLRLVADRFWRRRFRNEAHRWLLHPQGSYFIARGGRDIPPPVYANLALTNKCNLRCEICGSQKYLDQVGIVRSHMPLDRFEAVASDPLSASGRGGTQ